MRYGVRFRTPMRDRVSGSRTPYRNEATFAASIMRDGFAAIGFTNVTVEVVDYEPGKEQEYSPEWKQEPAATDPSSSQE